jgi:hypothetical protein
MTNSTATAAPTVTAVAVEVCVDCHLVAAGYSADEMGTAPEVEPWGLFADEPGHAYAEGTEEGFGTWPCQACGSTLAGDRFAATWLY